MPDLTYLDSRYFVDAHTFNCPFCNRKSVSYTLHHPASFHWSPGKECFIYRARCHSCHNDSMHLSFEQIPVRDVPYSLQAGTASRRFDVDQDVDLDSKFFYSVPTSFFVLDTRIPSVLRELVTEAEGCLKSNFLTGASACARKVVYELAVLEGAEGNNYEERLKSLKAKRQDVEPLYFDTLLTIQQVTSDKVHESSYDGWRSGHLRLILSTLVEILDSMYVIPKLREEKRRSILKLKDEILGRLTSKGKSGT